MGKSKVHTGDRPALHFHRFNDFAAEGFEGFGPAKISSNQHSDPPPQRQHGYV